MARPRLLLHYVMPPRVDWVQVMVDLYNAGCTAYRVAKHLKVHEGTARHWEHGNEPGYGNGRALLRLHAFYCGAALTIRREKEAESFTSTNAVASMA